MTVKIFGREVKLNTSLILIVILAAIIGFAATQELFKQKANTDIKLVSSSAKPSYTSKPASPGAVKVYVCGEVHKPGVYSLAKGSVVIDAIMKAGGATVKANLNFNLAWKIEQNVMIRVPTLNAKKTLPIIIKEISPADSGYVVLNSTSLPQIENSKININNATLEKLMELPGVGVSTAKKIIEYRKSNKFLKCEDLMNVSGIGEKKFAEMKQFVEI